MTMLRGLTDSTLSKTL